MSTLQRIYLVRGLVAIAWAVAFSATDRGLTAVPVILLIAYPLIDVVASLLDRQRANAALSALAAVALGVAAASGVGAVLFTFGVWAIVSGAAQLGAAVRRRGSGLGRQLPMLTAGGLSMIAGATYLFASAGTNPGLNALVTYTAAGGTFFVLQVATLAWRKRRPGLSQSRLQG